MHFKKGEIVFYQLEQGLVIRYLPAEILNVCPKRVVIRDCDGYKRKRIVMPKRIFRVVPPGARIG